MKDYGFFLDLMEKSIVSEWLHADLRLQKSSVSKEKCRFYEVQGEIFCGLIARKDFSHWSK